jgi:general stress protein 26
MDNKMFKRVSEIINECEEGYFSYIDKNSFPHTATRSKIKGDNISKFYFSTDLSGDMATAIIKDSRAGICFRQENNNITLTGRAKVITDPIIKKEMWLDWFINHYKEGPTDPEYCIIEFETKNLSLWVDNQIEKCSIESVQGSV